MAENGRNAYLAWIAHYKNEEGELSKRTTLVKAKLETLHYKNERSMSFFERCTEILTSVSIRFTRIRIRDTPRKLPQRKSSRKAYTETTSLTLAATFQSKFHESTHHPCWSTDKGDPVSAAFMPLVIDRQAAADGDEAAMGTLWRQRSTGWRMRMRK
jgi:hypothetical protein